MSSATRGKLPLCNVADSERAVPMTKYVVVGDRRRVQKTEKFPGKTQNQVLRRDSGGGGGGGPLDCRRDGEEAG
jgi:hypothetical protein